MKFIEKKLPKTHRIILFGDTHDGNILRHKNGHMALIDRIASEKNTYAIHMGDAIEAITVNDKRYRAEIIDSNSPVPIKQAKNVVKEHYPIRKKLITMLLGNHEDKLSHYGDLTEEIICEGLNVPYGTWTSVVSIKDLSGNNKQMYKMYLVHGRRGLNSNSPDPARREGNLRLSLKNVLFKKSADCLIMARAHTHKLVVYPPMKELLMVSDGKKLTQTYTTNPGNSKIIPDNLRWYISTGSFLKSNMPGVSSYSEMADYDPTELGYIEIIVEDGQVQDVQKVISY